MPRGLPVFPSSSGAPLLGSWTRDFHAGHSAADGDAGRAETRSGTTCAGGRSRSAGPRGPGARVGWDSRSHVRRGGRPGPSDACPASARVLPSPRLRAAFSPPVLLRRPPAGPGPERLIRVLSARPPSPDWRRLGWLRADGPARDGRALSSEGAGQARGPSHPWGNRTKKAKKMQKAQEDVSRRGSGQPRSWGPGRAAGVRPMRLRPRRPRAAFVLGKPSRAPHPGAHSRRAEMPAVAARGTAWPLAKAGS